LEGSQIGMLRAALIESAVTAATRQSENALSASDATTASISRVDATGALPPLNPVAPYDRVMVQVLARRANHPRNAKEIAIPVGFIGAGLLPDGHRG
jgi:hypothetical protein